MNRPKKRAATHTRQEVESLRERVAILEAAVTEQRTLERILESYEQDRDLIGYEIHDGFLQEVTGALLLLASLERHWPDSPRPAQEIIQRVLALLRSSIAEARTLIHGLRPRLSEMGGLQSALQAALDSWQSLGKPTIKLCWELNAIELSPRQEHAVFRIIQECLANARKHSQSDTVQVRLLQAAERLVVEVQDWGVGCDATATPSAGVGLEGIRLRAKLLGGAATISSSPGQGTTVVVTMPLLDTRQ